MSELSPQPDFLAAYPIVVTVPVQWGDQDAFAHVNNTVFLRWFEIGRIAYFRELGVDHVVANPKYAPILAAVSCSFERQVTFPDTVRVGSRVSRIGNKSVVVEHAVVSDSQNARVASGTSTMVYFDYHNNVSTPLTEEIRTAIQAIEKRRNS